MKYYPNCDRSFYVEKHSSWDKSEKYGSQHSWKMDSPRPFTPKIMYYWRDVEGVKKTEIKKEDLNIDLGPPDRIRPQACLGMLYATGYRFIKLTKAPPAGFKCAPLPVNLATARVVNENLKQMAKQAKQEEKKAKKEAAEAKKAAEAHKNRGQIRARN